MRIENRDTSLPWPARLLPALCFLICLTGACLLPVNMCPDEVGRRMLSDWIYYRGTLPTGNELATMLMSWVDTNAPVLSLIPGKEFDGWGFSYALRPYLSSIIAALFMKAASLLSASPAVLLAASRMGSVLSLTLCCRYCLRLGQRCFQGKYSPFFLSAIVCFLPQALFLGMYQNNDVLSLCAVSAMLCALAEGYDTHWPVKSCVKLAVALSVGALSYYSAYPWFLMGVVFCVLSVLRDEELPNKGSYILRRAALVAGICLVLAGWFFVRNAALHEGDFLGLTEELRSRERMAAAGYRLHEYNSARARGISFPAFLRDGNHWFFRMTARSFFGVFGYMNRLMPTWLYRVYYALTQLWGLGACVLLLFHRPSPRNRLLLLTAFSASLLTAALHVWQSYARDYQPQGRYIITLSLLLGFLSASGLEAIPVKSAREETRKRALPLAAGALWLVLCALAILTGMSQMLV